MRSSDYHGTRRPIERMVFPAYFQVTSGVPSKLSGAHGNQTDSEREESKDEAIVRWYPSVISVQSS